jgi:hypothetical protein
LAFFVVLSGFAPSREGPIGLAPLSGFAWAKAFNDCSYGPVMDRRPDGPEMPEESGGLDPSEVGFEAEDVDLDPDELELPGPEPVMDRDPAEFTIMTAAKPGPLPPDVERELRQLSKAIQPVLDDDDEGRIATRFGRRAIVAPVDQPTEAVEVADVDVPRSMVLTMGGKDPGATGSLLAQVLFQRTDVTVGYAQAPDIVGPTVANLQKLLPALRGPRASKVEGVGTVALGHRPAEVRSAIEDVLKAEDDGEDENEFDPDNVPAGR